MDLNYAADMRGTVLYVHVCMVLLMVWVEM